MVLGIQFWSVKCTTATVQYAKILSISILLLILIRRPSHQAMQATEIVRLYESKPLQNAFKRI